MNITVAVIGGGYFASFHLKAWLRLASVTVIALVEKDPEKLRTHALEHSNLLCTDSIDKLHELPSIDIIDIATPPDTHAQLISEALQLDCSIIVCQKPFCQTMESAFEVEKAVSQSGKKLVIHENFRFQPWYRAIKSQLQSNVLGDILQASFRLRPGDGQGTDAYLARQPYFRQMEKFLIRETGIHFIDLFRYLFGEPDAISAELRQLNPELSGEDAGYFIFHYQHGMLAHFDGNRLLDHATHNTRLTMGEMLIEGTCASLSLHGNGNLLVRKFGETHWLPVNYKFEDRDFGGDCVYHLQKHIVRHVVHKTPLENEAHDYLQNLALEELVYQAASSHTRLDTVNTRMNV